MGVGVKLLKVQCNLETATGSWHRRRQRQRRRSSDELALFVCMHDLKSKKLLAHYKYYRGDVDSGDTFRPEHSLLAAKDSSKIIVMSLIGLEIDGAGKLSNLAEKEYRKWKAHFKNPDHLEWPKHPTKIVPYQPLKNKFLNSIPNRFDMDDLIMLDRFYFSTNIIDGLINKGNVPGVHTYSILGEAMTVQSSFDRRDTELITTRDYISKNNNSIYSLTFNFYNENSILSSKR